MKKNHTALAAALLLPLIVPAVALTDDDDDERDRQRSQSWAQTGIVARVRAATRDYRDVDYAMAMGYLPGPCVSGRDGGAMGVHFVKGELLDAAPPVLEQPEALIYEPLPSGGYRLVGVEYITFAGPAALEGHLFNYSGAPNRYGIPDPYYELHVWAWKRNPIGTFADWHPNVTCDAFVPSI
jgi:hypothetical protein